jgi:tight adherence protein B
MSLTLALLAASVAALALLGYGLLATPAPAKAGQRRLQAVRLRHSESTSVKVESQLRKAIAARRPTMHRLAGSSSHLDALALRLERTGLPWTVKHYLVATASLTAFLAAMIYLTSGAFVLALGVGIVVGAGLPHLVVGRLVKRRLGAFNARFPDAIELLVRGLRSGLPVSETLGIVAREVPGPVGAEFRAVVERIKIGRTMEEALQVTADKLATAEFQFFVITLAIQRETGGNLAETLSNLADVLRKRAQMKLKIKALSSESKASAIIVGALPFAVFGMIWWINPEYLAGFFADDRLIVTGLGGMVWMAAGVFIMSRMVSFEI